MTDTQRDGVIGLVALCLLSAILTGKGQDALLRASNRLVVGGKSSVRLRPTGPFGALAGRVSLARVCASGGVLSPDAIAGRPRGTRIPAHIRLLALDVRKTSLDALPVERFLAGVEDVRVEGLGIVYGGDIEIRSSGGGRAVVIIAAGAVERLIRSEWPFLESPRVALTPEGVFVSGRSTLPIMPGEVLAAARLKIVGGGDVTLGEQRAWLDGRELPPGLVKNVLAKIGPVFSMTRYPAWADRFRLREVVTDEGTVQIGLDVIPLGRGSDR